MGGRSISHGLKPHSPAELEWTMNRFTFGGQRSREDHWEQRISRLDYALQPIVNIHTGLSYGVEALLRNVADGGFETINEVFETAHGDGMLHFVDLKLREKAVEKFAGLGWSHQAKLFFNLDNRVLDSRQYRPGATLDILARFDLPQESLCFEISEKHELHDANEAVLALDAYRVQGFKIAVDDCGTGFSGLKLLYYTKPDFIKIDRFFIQDIARDPNKRVFVHSIVNIAHLMGSVVIAEGVETEQEYYSCRDIGCDLIQGYFVCPPQLEIDELHSRYDAIETLSVQDRRHHSSEDRRLIDMEIEYLDPVGSDCEVFEIFKRFSRKDDGIGFFPVINSNGEPLGVISEKSFKEYAYNPFGTDLLQNPAFGKQVNKFITRFPIADIHTPAEKILEIYSQNETIEGIIIVEHMRYKGFLSARALLKVLNEKNIALARDQNPLTRLPGNTLIHEYVSRALSSRDRRYCLIYFDFDNFKPYNDRYGFRSGDRVILRFAEMLKAWSEYHHRFAGHIGGDDFFMGAEGVALDRIRTEVRGLADQFRTDVESFYDPETIERGYIRGKSRSGEIRKFPLLTVSSVILELPPNRARIYSTEEISTLMARLKKQAKASPEKLRTACVCAIDQGAVRLYKYADSPKDVSAGRDEPGLAE